jgi:hypothetical protein
VKYTLELIRNLTQDFDFALRILHPPYWLFHAKFNTLFFYFAIFHEILYYENYIYFVNFLEISRKRGEICRRVHLMQFIEGFCRQGNIFEIPCLYSAYYDENSVFLSL